MAQTEQSNKLTFAYAHCKNIAKSNYENFPVASVILPKNLRKAISVIYAFARTADNYVDNNIMTTEAKLNAIANLERPLRNLQQDPLYQPADDNLLLALVATIVNNNLPITPFLDLLTAFKLDINKNRYYDFGEVLNYCCYSANPIGRLLLSLTKQDTLENLEYSDYICTGLQLINFLQDLPADLINLDRCYLPLNELSKYKVSIDELKNKQNSANLTDLIKYQLERISSIYNKGVPLGSKLNGLFGFEIRLIISGGNQILKALATRKNPYQRPTLTFTNKLKMFMLSLFSNNFISEDPIMADYHD